LERTDGIARASKPVLILFTQIGGIVLGLASTTLGKQA